MRKNKIRPRLLMIAPLPPPVHGSAMVTKYIKDSELINSKFNLDWVNLSTSRSMNEIGKRNPKKIFRFLGAYIKTFWKLISSHYDACYLAITCHGPGFLKDAPFALLCRLFGNRIIIHQHNKGMSKDANKPIYKFLLRSVYKKAKVILLSERLYPDISSIVDHSQVVICPNGIPETEVGIHNDNSIPRILFLSNLIKSKGVTTLLDACQILKKEGYKFTCNFVGGETQEITKEIFESEVKSRGLDHIVSDKSTYISYLGRKYGEDKNKIIAQSDIFVFPTTYHNECFPVVLLEAMQQSKAIITTQEGGIPDIVPDGECGIIVHDNTPETLAKKIALLIDNPSLRQELGRNAYKRYKECLTLGSFEKNILSALMP